MKREKTKGGYKKMYICSSWQVDHVAEEDRTSKIILEAQIVFHGLKNKTQIWIGKEGNTELGRFENV